MQPYPEVTLPRVTFFFAPRKDQIEKGMHQIVDTWCVGSPPGLPPPHFSTTASILAISISASLETWAAPKYNLDLTL